MPDTSILNRLFSKDAKIVLASHYSNKKKVVLRESQTSDSLIEIRNVPTDAVVIDLDRVFSNNTLFSGDQGECKRGDYIIFSEQSKKIVFIEMKRSASSLKEIIKQLKGSLCCFEYIQSIVKEFYNEPRFLSAYDKRFVSINHTGMTNRKTAIEKYAGMHFTPDDPLKVSWTQTIEFNKIAS